MSTLQATTHVSAGAATAPKLDILSSVLRFFVRLGAATRTAQAVRSRRQPARRDLEILGIDPDHRFPY